MSPEGKREYRRRYYQANRDRIREQSRQWYAANTEQAKETSRRYQKANREQRREIERRWREANPERARASTQRYRRTAKARFAIEIRKHGPAIHEYWAVTWERQDGRCYLCTDPLDLDKAWEVHIDHDHSCCPTGRTCPYCRRGLACRRCNTLIGHVNDDPDLLRKIADNLEPVLMATRKRLAIKPVQDVLC